MTTTNGTNHYAHVRYVGLNARITGENEAPLRLVKGQLGVKRRGYILPVTGIDDDGFAIVPIVDEQGRTAAAGGSHTLGETPRTKEGHWDYEALAAQFPPVTDPWSVDVLDGLKTRGQKPQPKADASPKAKGKAKSAKPTAMKVTAKGRGKGKTAAAKPEASKLSVDDLAGAIGGMSASDRAALIAKLTA